jgi:hypothetical protein
MKFTLNEYGLSIVKTRITEGIIAVNTYEFESPQFLAGMAHATSLLIRQENGAKIIDQTFARDFFEITDYFLEQAQK